MIEQFHPLFIDPKLRESFFCEFQEMRLHLPSIVLTSEAALQVVQCLVFARLFCLIM